MLKKIVHIHIVVISLMVMFSACSDAQNLKYYTFKIDEILPHDISSYTQGLFFYNGELYESAGQYGESSMRKIELSSGKVIKRENFDAKYFIEGSCVVNGRLYILTWREGICFVYDIENFKKLGQFRNMREGWGLTTDGKDLIMSNGSAQLYFIDPETFIDKRSITVRLNGKTVPYINELEYINGEIWANIYGDDRIIIVNPESGSVSAVVDCSNILPDNLRTSRTDVLNGIAYNEKTESIYITGKYWPKMYKISIVAKGEKNKKK